ncbi:deaminase-reductase domain-containing protein, partial [Pseudomonas putida S11]
MRKLIVAAFISLDGVMQAPGGPQEDTSGGFTYGGWIVPYAEEVFGQAMQ